MSTIDRLKEIAPGHEIVLIECEHPKEATEKSWDVQFTDCKESTYAKIIETVETERTVIATDNKKELKKVKRLIKARYRDIRILSIYSEPDHEDQAKIQKFYRDRTPTPTPMTRVFHVRKMIGLRR